MAWIVQALQKPLRWLGSVIAAEITKPLDEIKRIQETQGRDIAQLFGKIEQLHKIDPVAEECDLAILDDCICRLIRYCREKGNTTSEDRRRVTRMHEAYKARGGNHGEENEYKIFCQLPTEEEFLRTKGESA